MKFRTKAHQGKFLKRYKRFFADVLLNGEIVVTHVANTGSLKGAISEGCDCLVTEADNPERKLRYSLQAVRGAEGGWIGVNTSWPNALAAEAFRLQLLPKWKNFSDLKSEVKISLETRLDLMLTGEQRQRFVEIKNVSMAVPRSVGDNVILSAEFPDAVTERGQKHLRELMDLVKKGAEAEILFIVQRTDCQYFSPAAEIDPEYSLLLKMATESGVEVTILSVDITEKGLELRPQELPIIWDFTNLKT